MFVFILNKGTCFCVCFFVCFGFFFYLVGGEGGEVARFSWFGVFY